MKLRDFLNTIDVYAEECRFKVKYLNGATMTFKEAWAIPQDMQNRSIYGKVDFIAYSDCWGDVTGIEINIVLE